MKPPNAKPSRPTKRHLSFDSLFFTLIYLFFVKFFQRVWFHCFVENIVSVEGSILMKTIVHDEQKRSGAQLNRRKVNRSVWIVSLNEQHTHTQRHSLGSWHIIDFSTGDLIARHSIVIYRSKGLLNAKRALFNVQSQSLFHWLMAKFIYLFRLNQIEWAASNEMLKPDFGSNGCDCGRVSF